MPPIKANSNDSKIARTIFFYTNRKILSQEMTMRNMEALISYFFRSNANIKIGKISWSKG